MIPGVQTPCREAFDAHVESGYVRCSRSGDLTVYSYTSKAVIERRWNDVTRQARGIVFNGSNQVVARPFDKFFNLGEMAESSLTRLPSGQPELAEKHDGSLVIVFWDGRQWRCCTRGAFDNIQCTWAREWLKAADKRLDPPYTYMFELVAPWNRIVTPYHVEDMILIGMRHTERGGDFSYAELDDVAREDGLTPCKWHRGAISSIDLSRSPSLTKEGYVARFDNGLRVKLKFADYLRLHRLMTVLSPRSVWQDIKDGNPVPASVPHEFRSWYHSRAAEVYQCMADYESEARAAYLAAPTHAERKAFAEFAKSKGPIAPILFRMLDGRPFDDLLLTLAKPAAGAPFSGGGA